MFQQFRQVLPVPYCDEEFKRRMLPALFHESMKKVKIGGMVEIEEEHFYELAFETKIRI
jgi:hypothetical protein